MGLLSLAIWTPIVFGIILLAVGRDEHAKAARWFALVGAIVSLLVTLPLYGGFQYDTAAMQFVERWDWIPRFNIELPPGSGRHLLLVCAADRLHHRGGGDCGLGGH
jgi:NADH:ubiquinone oxidoreductase subunit 4 (subunit M)